MRQITAGCFVAAAAVLAGDLCVSPQGNDANPGTREKPLATLQRALVLARETKPETIWLAPGEYEVLDGLVLDEGLGATAEAPLTIRATQSIDRDYLKKRALNVGEGVVGHVAKENKPYVSTDLLNDPWFKEKELARSMGLQSILSVPMSVGDRVVGVDVNQDYLDACKQRHAHLGDKLATVRADLTKPCPELGTAELLIADLFIEYIGIVAFVARVKECAPKTLCCVIQKNVSAAFVSTSPYMQALSGIGALHRDIEETELVSALAEIGYMVVHREEVPLKNGKMFVGLECGKRFIS
ncbi:MAG: DUF1565 domain-containing protein [Clostridia bacterium]|nr:DUF1565 domain-containing protein [Clostridia bacterium]